MIKEMVSHSQKLKLHTLLVTFHQKFFILRLEKRRVKQFAFSVTVKHLAKHPRI